MKFTIPENDVLKKCAEINHPVPVDQAIAALYWSLNNTRNTRGKNEHGLRYTMDEWGISVD